MTPPNRPSVIAHKPAASDPSNPSHATYRHRPADAALVELATEVLPVPALTPAVTVVVALLLCVADVPAVPFEE